MDSAEFDKTSGFFTAFRKELGFPYFHRDEPAYLFRGLGLWGMTLIYTMAVLVVTVIIAFLGTRGYSRWKIALQMTISLTIGIIIIVCLTGVTWQAGDYATTTNDSQAFDYAIHVGLLQANISMKRYDTSMEATKSDVVEYHNVKLGWYEIDQAEKEYHEALLAGWPSVLLRFARYLSADMGEITFMRKFRWSGYSAYVLLWAAFAVWVYSNILFASNISMGALMLLCTGILQLLAVIIYAAEQPKDFAIPLSGDLEGRKLLKLRYSWMFWLITFMGTFVVIISLLMLVLDYLRPEDMNKFFGTETQISVPGSAHPLDGYKNKDLKALIRTFSKTQKHDTLRLSDAESDISFAFNDQRSEAGTPYRSNLDVPSLATSRRTSIGSADGMELNQMSPMNFATQKDSPRSERNQTRGVSPEDNNFPTERRQGPDVYDNPGFLPENEKKTEKLSPLAASPDTNDQILPADSANGAAQSGAEVNTPVKEMKRPPQIEVHAIDETYYVGINLNDETPDQPITMHDEV